MWIVLVEWAPIGYAPKPPYHLRDVDREAARPRVPLAVTTIPTVCGLELAARDVVASAPPSAHAVCSDCTTANAKRTPPPPKSTPGNLLE